MKDGAGTEECDVTQAEYQSSSIHIVVGGNAGPFFYFCPSTVFLWESAVIWRSAEHPVELTVLSGGEGWQLGELNCSRCL